jgi:hypothetical protein
MFRKLRIIILTSTFYFIAQKSIGQSENKVNFDKIISQVKEWNYVNKTEDTLKLPLIYKNDNFSAEISSNPINFELNNVVVKNPFDKKYPLSYSVVYNDRLITLFEQGFICISIFTLKRDKKFEKTLNTRNFEYHWLLNEKLVGFSSGKYYTLNNENIWTEYNESIPLSKQPKLFEDDKYLSFFDCKGEWGGKVYFFNKHTKTTHFTQATCANSIIKKDANYYVLSHLGHGFGSTKLEVVFNPDNLPIIDLKSKKTTYKSDHFNYNVIPETIFDFEKIQIFSSFKYNDKILYLVNWSHQNFIAEIENSKIKIINPLFNNEFYTHDPVTTTYDKTTLINLDFYGVAGEREVSCIIIRDGKLIKLDWNKKHFY